MGPCLLPLLYDILLMFRLGTSAITADIKQGFLQVLVDKKDDFFDFCGTMTFSVMILIVSSIDLQELFSV